jgi:hypothetical protein
MLLGGFIEHLEGEPPSWLLVRSDIEPIIDVVADGFPLS